MAGHTIAPAASNTGKQVLIALQRVPGAACRASGDPKCLVAHDHTCGVSKTALPAPCIHTLPRLMHRLRNPLTEGVLAPLLLA